MNKNNFSLRIILLICLGSALEYYDFIIYGISAPLFAQHFFPTGNHNSALLNTLAIFAVGYFARPLGGAVMGNIADKIGRKTIFLFAIALMGIATMSIGLLPSYHTIGIFAPICLIFLRMLQGFALGGELPGAVTYISEHLYFQHTGFALGILATFLSLGAMSAMGLLALLNHYMSTAMLMEFGWRIPFWFAGILALVGFYLRHQLFETRIFLDYLHSKTIRAPWRELRLHLRALLTGLIITVLPACLVILGITFPSYLHQTYHYSLLAIYRVVTISQLLIALITPLTGKLADRISPSRLLQWTLGLFILLIYPLFQLLLQGSLSHLLIFSLVYHLFLAFFVVTYLPMLARLFPVGVRFSGVAWCYNLSYVVAGNLPWILSALGNTPHIQSLLPETLMILAIFILVFTCRTRRCEATDN